MELEELAELALAAARRPAVEYADARAVEELAESIDARDDHVEGVSRSRSRGVGVRVLVGGRWGFAASHEPTAEAVRAAADRAVDIARASRGVGAAVVRLDDTPPPAGRYTSPHTIDPFTVPLADKVDHLLATTAAGRDVPGIAYVEATTDSWRRGTSFRSTDGGWFDQTVLQVGGGLLATAVAAGEVQVRSYPNSFRGQFGCGGWEQVLALDLPGHAAEASRDAVALLSAPDLPARSTTLVLGSSQLALQVHESVGHPTELDRILGMERAFAGTSFLDVSDRGRLRYGSDLVSVTADATTPGALGTFGYDDDGVPAGREPIIVDGILEGFLTNRETAAVIGTRSNGTARADSWGTIPLVRMNNVSLEPREGDLAAIVADTSDGVLMLTNRSWSIDDRRVNFQFGCEVAYEIRHGTIGRMFRNPTYAGRTTEFWGSCDAIGGPEDWRMWGIPNCGKGQPMQVARVAHGTATGRFRDVTVGMR